MMMSSIIPGLPPGFRMEPTDQELILEYLCPKVCDPQGFRPVMVPECDLYDAEEKWKSWFEITGESKLYCFTQLKKKKKKEEKGMRVERSFGEAVWKAQREDPIFLEGPDDQKIPIGVKRSFSYKLKKSATDDGASSSSRESSENNVWVMHEFLLHDFHHDGYVLCCVRKKDQDRSDKQHREIQLIHI